MDLARVHLHQRRRWEKKARAATAAGATLPEDVVLEILGRLADDHAVAALFRCATACKRWRGLVSDPSFLGGRRSPDISSSLLLLGFFAKHRPYRPRTVSADPLLGARSPAFVPAPRSPLGPGRRSLASFVACPPGYLDELDDAEPLVARHGILLVRLAPPRYGARVDDVGAGRTLVHLAVCNLLVGTCDVLPPLKCRATSRIVSCTIVTDEDCCSSPQPSSPSPSYFAALYKVLVIVFNRATQNNYLCSFSAAQCSWNTPTRLDHSCVGVKDAVVCQGMASWLARNSQGFYILDVCVESGNVYLTDLPDPEGHDDSDDMPLRSVAADADGTTLSMFLLDECCGRLEKWTLLEADEEGGGDEDEDDEDGDVGAADWLLSKVIEVKPPEDENSRPVIYFSVGERSGTLLVVDAAQRVYVVDLGTGEKEEVTERFRRLKLRTAVPVEMDWLAFFSSRLEGTRGKGEREPNENS